MPDNELCFVLSFLSATELARSRGVCRRWRRVASSPFLWARGPSVLVDGPIMPGRFPDYASSVCRELIVHGGEAPRNILNLGVMDAFFVGLPQLLKLEIGGACTVELATALLFCIPSSCQELNIFAAVSLDYTDYCDFLVSPRARNLKLLRCLVDVPDFGVEPEARNLLAGFPPKLEDLTIHATLLDSPALASIESNVRVLTVFGNGMSVDAGVLGRVARFSGLRSVLFTTLAGGLPEIVAALAALPELRKLKFGDCAWDEVLDAIPAKGWPSRDKIHLEVLKFDLCFLPGDDGDDGDDAFFDSVLSNIGHDLVELSVETFDTIGQVLISSIAKNLGAKLETLALCGPFEPGIALSLPMPALRNLAVFPHHVEGHFPATLLGDGRSFPALERLSIKGLTEEDVIPGDFFAPRLREVNISMWEHCAPVLLAEIFGSGNYVGVTELRVMAKQLEVLASAYDVFPNLKVVRIFETECPPELVTLFQDARPNVAVVHCRN